MPSPPKTARAPERQDRSHAIWNISESRIWKQPRKAAAASPARRPQPGRRDYDLQGDSKALWEQVAAALHLKVVFDPDYQPTHAFRFELTDADYRDALRALQAATDSFLVPISQRLIFVANDSTQKRTEFERTVAVVVPFPETISVQELQEIATSIRGALDSQKLMVDTTRHLILIRDKVTKVRLAQKLLARFAAPARASVHRRRNSDHRRFVVAELRSIAADVVSASRAS